MSQRIFRVYGRVQGVGFRWWTRSQAQRLGVTGTVQNCTDGSVEVRAHGDTELLKELRRLLHEGPPTAEVQRVEETEAEGPPPDRFEIVT